MTKSKRISSSPKNFPAIPAPTIKTSTSGLGKVPSGFADEDDEARTTARRGGEGEGGGEERL